MNRYEKYKDSGFHWIGEIPEHWGVKKLKYLTLIGNGKDHKGVWDVNGEFPIIGTGGKFGNANAFLYDKPSVILGRKGTIDKPQFIEVPFWAVDTAYYTIVQEYTSPKYLFYLTKTINFDLYKYGSAVPSMNQEVIKEIYFAVPEKPEQTAIANYLDRKTAEIDQLIAQKEQLLELYEEEKKAIINQAVTKGLPCKDARTCVSFKDSGIDWLGDIPEHWEVKKLKYVTKDIITGKTPSSSNSSYYNGDIDWFSPGDFNNNFILNDSNRKITKQAISEARMKIYPPNSVLLVGIGATLGKLGISINASTSNQQINAIIFDEKIVNPFYGLYFLLSIKNAIIRLANAATLAIFNQTQTKEFEIFIPSSEEQTAIVQYIETETTRINTKAKKTKKLIELLKEYKQSLISEVVTGKVKVM